MIITRTDVLSGAAPQQIQKQASLLDPSWLADLAVCLAVDPDLRVSVITYADGATALEVLALPPYHSGYTGARREVTRLGAPRTPSA